MRGKAFGKGESGAVAIAPGKPDASEVMKRVTKPDDDEHLMPPSGDRLTPAEVAKVKAWIAAGAKWEDPGSTTAPQVATGVGAWNAGPSGIRIATSGGRSPEWDNRPYDPDAVWAYRPIQRPPVPAPKANTHPIDAFHLHGRPGLRVLAQGETLRLHVQWRFESR